MRYEFLATAVLVVVCSGPLVVAQPAGEKDPQLKPSPPPAMGSERESSRCLEGLPAETRKRFLAAREKTLEDPKLQQLRMNAERAKREFFKAMRDKMLEIDPGLAEIIKKRVMERKAHEVWRDRGGLGSLSDEERKKVLSAMEQVDNDPAVDAAKKKRWEASSEGERKAAAENYRKALRDAMVKVDPSFARILDKLDPEKGSIPNPPEGSPLGEE